MARLTSRAARRVVLAAVIGVVYACSPSPTGPGGGTGGGGGGAGGGGGGGPITSADIVLVGAGDIAICGQPGAPLTAQLMQTALDKYPNATAFTAGDNAYPSGSASEFQECYEPTWGKFKARTRAAPGNHDYTEPTASAYYAYFRDGAGPAGLGYYAFTLGGWRVISLNSEILGGGQGPNATAAAAQMTWLRDELATNHHDCTAAIFHRPLFSSGPNGNNADMKEIWRALYDANVDIVLNGHDHLYEKFGPQDPDGHADSGRGIRQFTVGSGGAAIYQRQSNQPNSELLISDWGIIALNFNSNSSYSWEFTSITQSGVSQVRDSGVGSCH